ncbi:MAG: four helix bundle protein [Bacteroidota bacterium]
MSQTPPQDPLIQHNTQFAIAIRDFGKVIPMTVSNVEDLKELIRVSGSIGARYIQAKQASSKPNYIQLLAASQADTQVTIHWLNLIDTQGSRDLEHRRNQLIKAAEELSRVLLQLIQKGRNG